MTHDAPLTALADIVRDTVARDGALAVVQGDDLLITQSLRMRIPHRLVDASACRQLCAVLSEGAPQWLEPDAVQALYLSAGTEVLAIPFPPGHVRRVAFVAYDERVHLSWADRHFFQRALSLSLDAPTLPMAA